MVRRRYTRQQWAGWIAEQTGSGMSVVAFCEARGLGAQSFYLWRRKLSAEEQQEGQGSSFVSVSVTGLWQVEIDLPCGATIRVPPDSVAMRRVTSQPFRLTLSMHSTVRLHRQQTKPVYVGCERRMMASERSQAIVRRLRSKQISFEHDGQDIERVGSHSQMTRVPDAILNITPHIVTSCRVMVSIGCSHQGHLIKAIRRAARRSPHIISGIAMAYIGKQSVTTMRSIAEDSIRIGEPSF